MEFRHPSLEGRAAIVTGGGRGLGRELALALVRAGARVAISGRTAAEIEKVAAEAERLRPGALVAVRADVRDPAACERLVGRAVEAFGTVHALVNNAAIGLVYLSETFNTRPLAFYDAPPERWREMVEVNVTGPFNMARLVAPVMLRAGFGRIVNVSTSPVTMTRKGYSPYGPSKAALEAMTRVWAQDLDGTGVTVNAILPGGATDTAMIPGTGAARRGADGQLLPANVLNNAALWLLSDASNGVTGRRIVGRLWDAALPPDAAARNAMPPPSDLPSIL